MYPSGMLPSQALATLNSKPGTAHMLPKAVAHSIGISDARHRTHRDEFIADRRSRHDVGVVSSRSRFSTFRSDRDSKMTSDDRVFPQAVPPPI